MVSKEMVIEALKIMGPSYLRKSYRSQWSVSNPTRGYCYVVSEMLYHNYRSKGVEVEPYQMWVEYPTEYPGDASDTMVSESHWFIIKENSLVIDWTSEQYGDRVKLDYTAANKKNFLTKMPSKRCMELIKLILALGGKARR